MSSTALITGASGGIGLEFAKIIAKEGINLVLVARSKDKLLKIQEELTKKHDIEVEVIATDLSDLQAAEYIFTETEKQKIEIDILINNAGIGGYGDFVERESKEVQAMMNLDMGSLTQLCLRYGKKMKQKMSGKILNVASTAAFQPLPQMAVYAACKAYVLNFSESIAYELKPFGVAVTALCPGATKTGFDKTAGNTNTKLFRGKTTTPKEVAQHGWQSLNSGKTVSVYPVRNLLLAELVRFLPRNTVTKLAAGAMEEIK